MSTHPTHTDQPYEEKPLNAPTTDPTAGLPGPSREIAIPDPDPLQVPDLPDTAPAPDPAPDREPVPVGPGRDEETEGCR